MGTHTKSWIVSPVYDLGFFILPCLLSLAIFALYQVLAHLEIPNLTWWVFGIYVVFDGLFDTGLFYAVWDYYGLDFIFRTVRHLGYCH